MLQTHHIIRTFLATLFITCAVLTVVSCHDSSQQSTANWDLTQEQRDSADFTRYHHYNVGTNLVVIKDSLKLNPTPVGWPMSIDMTSDSAAICEGEDFVVTEIFKPNNPDSLQTDSVWVRIGTDGKPLGWVTEADLLDKSISVGPIARSIYWFSTYHIYWFIIVVVVAGAIVLLRWKKGKSLGLIFNIHKMDSFYPTAFCISIATAAMIYATIQTFATDSWIEFSYNYSLNPLGQPWLLCSFLVFTWLSVILLLSVVFDMGHKLSPFDFLSFMFGLLTWGGIIYIVVTTTAEYYIGYVIYAAYVIIALQQYIRHKVHK